MDSNDFVSVNHILAEALVNVNDVDLRNGFTKGWFVSRIQDALQEIAIDTFYQKITDDFDFPKDRLAIPIPENAFNIREMYLYNNDCCNPSGSVPVVWKRLFNNKGGASSGYTAKIKGSGNVNEARNPFYPTHRGADNYYYANIQHGMIMFSSSCASYKKVRIVYNGMGVSIGDEPIIPRFFERYINDYVEEKYYSAMKPRDPRKYRGLWSDAYSKLERSSEKAKIRVSSMNTFEKESLEEYIGNILAK